MRSTLSFLLVASLQWPTIAGAQPGEQRDEGGSNPISQQQPSAARWASAGARAQEELATREMPTESPATESPATESPATESPATESPANELDRLMGMDLEELLTIQVVTATKTKQSLEEAPSIIAVITAKDIRRRGYRTVGEALRHQPGVAVINDLVYWNVGIRGLYAGSNAASDTVKVMINGQPTAFRSTSSALFGHDLIPIEAVKRIEVVRGPASAVYGANALLGVVNIITFRGEDFAGAYPRAKVSLDGYLMQNPENTSLNGTVALVGGWQTGDLQFFLSGTYTRADRSGLVIPGVRDMLEDYRYSRAPELYPEPDYFPTPGWNRPERRNLLFSSPSQGDLEKAASIYALVSYALSDVGELSADGSWQFFDRFGEFQAYSYLTHANRVSLSNGFARLRLVRAPGKHGFFYRLSAAYSSGSPTDAEATVSFDSPGVRQRRHLGYHAFDGVAEAGYVFNDSLNLFLGLDFTYDVEQPLSVEIVGEGLDEEDKQEDRVFQNLGIYGHVAWDPIPNLGLTLGFRLDHNSIVACDSAEWDCLVRLEDTEYRQSSGETGVIADRGLLQLSSRAAVVYAFPWFGMYSKLLYGSSFKPPSPFQLYHSPFQRSVGNPALKPQSADTAEFLLGAKPVDGLHLTADVFYTAVTNMVVSFKDLGLIRNRNSNANIVGLEAALSYTWKDRFSVYADASYLLMHELRPQKMSTESASAWENSSFNATIPIGMYPRLLAGWGVNVALSEQHLNANLNVRFVGERDASVLNNQLYNATDLSKTYSFAPYFMVDCTISSVGLELIAGRETRFSASLRHVPGSYQEPGRGGVDIPSLGSMVFLRLDQDI
jgi:outer membrane receptor protein involved in Fe transport